MSGDDTTTSMANTTQEAQLVRVIEENDEELVELLRLLATTEELATDLAPELRAVVRENRGPLQDLRVAFEREETLRLLTRVGEEAETLAELLDVLAASKDLTDDLAPELLVAVRENRDVIERVRGTVEREETLVLLEHIGENADTLVDLLDLLDATVDLATELTPELRKTVHGNRDVIRDFRLVAAGFADAQAEHEVDAYELGRSAGNAIGFVQAVGEPDVTQALNATLDGLVQNDSKPVGFFGLLKALFDADVRRGLGRLITAVRSLGRANMDD